MIWIKIQPKNSEEYPGDTWLNNIKHEILQEFGINLIWGAIIMVFGAWWAYHNFSIISNEMIVK